MLCAFQQESRKFESTSRHCVATLDKLLTHNCLRGRQRETTSLTSSSSNKPAFRQRTIIIIIIIITIHKNCTGIETWLTSSKTKEDNNIISRLNHVQAGRT